MPKERVGPEFWVGVRNAIILTLAGWGLVWALMLVFG